MLKDILSNAEGHPKLLKKQHYSYMYSPPTAITATQSVATSSHPIASYNNESYAVNACACV